MQCPECGSEWKASNRIDLIQRCPFCGASLEKEAPRPITFTNAKEGVRYIVDNFGSDVIVDNERFTKLLNKFMPKLKQERKVIVEAMNEGVCTTLYDVTDQSEIDKCIAILQSIKILTQDACMAEKWACYAVETIVYALGWSVPMFGITPNIHMYQIPETVSHPWNQENPNEVWVQPNQVWVNPVESNGDAWDSQKQDVIEVSEEELNKPSEKNQIPVYDTHIFEQPSENDKSVEPQAEKSNEPVVESPVIEPPTEEAQEPVIESPVIEPPTEEAQEPVIESPVFEPPTEEVQEPVIEPVDDKTSVAEQVNEENHQNNAPQQPRQPVDLLLPLAVTPFVDRLGNVRIPDRMQVRVASEETHGPLVAAQVAQPSEVHRAVHVPDQVNQHLERERLLLGCEASRLEFLRESGHRRQHVAPGIPGHALQRLAFVDIEVVPGFRIGVFGPVAGEVEPVGDVDGRVAVERLADLLCRFGRQTAFGDIRRHVVPLLSPCERPAGEKKT